MLLDRFPILLYIISIIIWPGTVFVWTIIGSIFIATFLWLKAMGFVVEEIKDSVSY